MSSRAVGVVTAVCLLLGLSTTALAFDGKRKGFTLGGGLGGGFTSFKQEFALPLLPTVQSETESKGAFVTDLRIGYGPSEQLDICYVNKVSWFAMTNVLNESVTIVNSTGGLGLTYYFAPQAPSVYLLGLIGLSTWAAPFESNSDTWVGFGVGGGIGYEFVPHWAVEGSLSYGNPQTSSGPLTLTTKATSLRLSLNVLGY
jgi:opacity protein-like surface antigen